jgi:hypothetical protein
MESKQPSKLPAPPMLPEATAPATTEVVEDEVGARDNSTSPRALSSGADLARESEGDGGAMRTRWVLASRLPVRKLVLDSAVGDSQMAPPPSVGFCLTSLLSLTSEPQLDFFMTLLLLFF